MSQEIVSPVDLEKTRAQFRGALLGLAVGDALGSPLEFQPAREPSDYVTDMIGGGWLQLPPGMWTDDTAMTLAAVDSLIAKQVFDPDDIAKRLVAWKNTAPPDINVQTAHILDAIARGESWESATAKSYHSDPASTPSGALLRCTPLALFFYRRPGYVAVLSPVMSRITLAHPDAEWACVFLNVALSWLLQGDGKLTAIEAAATACMGASSALQERIERTLSPRCDTAPKGGALDTLEVAVWVFLHTSSFEAALVNVVNRGGDAATAGAVAGALAGAFYGLPGIPERWLAPLHDRERLLSNADRLLALAQES